MPQAIPGIFEDIRNGNIACLGHVARGEARSWKTMERHMFQISENGDDMPEVGDWRWYA